MPPHYTVASGPTLGTCSARPPSLWGVPHCQQPLLWCGLPPLLPSSASSLGDSGAPGHSTVQLTLPLPPPSSAPPPDGPRTPGKCGVGGRFCIFTSDPVKAISPRVGLWPRTLTYLLYFIPTSLLFFCSPCSGNLCSVMVSSEL